MRQWRILARHKWVSGATITESVNESDRDVRRFTATIRGWRNFQIYEGNPRSIDVNRIAHKVREIRDRIDSGDELVFQEDTKITA